MHRRLRHHWMRYGFMLLLSLALLPIARTRVVGAIVRCLSVAALAPIWLSVRCKGRLFGRSSIGEGVIHFRDALRHRPAGEARSQAMLESALDAIIMMDHEGRVIEWNPAAEQTFEYGRAEAIGRQLAELVIPESLRTRHRDGLARYLRTGEPKILGRRIEMPAQRADGSQFPAELTVVRVNLTGPPVFTGFVRDLSERRRTEDALRVSDQRLRLLAESSNDVVYRYRFRPTRGFDYVSPAAFKVMGYTPEEHYTDPDLPYKMIHPADRHLLDGLIEEGTHGNPVDLRWVRKDGAVVIAEHRDTPIYDEDRNIVAVHGIARDVTARRGDEREHRLLAEVGGVLASTLDSEQTAEKVGRLAVGCCADCCIIELVAGEGTARLVKVAHGDPSKTKVAETLERGLLEQVHARRFLSVLESERATLIPEISSQELQSAASSPALVEELRALALVSYMGFPLRARGRLLGVLSLISSDPGRRYGDKDLSLGQELAHRTSLAIENADLYRAAQEAVRARDDVLSIVAHDLRNPLSAVRMLANSIVRDSPDDPAWVSVRQAAEKIDRSVERANGLIQDLLDVAQIEAGSLAVQRAPVAASELMSDAAEMFTMLASEASLRLTTDLPQELPPVLADRDRVLQVFSNVVGNAIKFTPAGGSIRIRATYDDGQVCFRIEDSGAGIPPEEVPHLFDRFWQAQHGDRRGAGLGLPIAKGIVEAHGGRLWVDSTPGRGSTFLFTLQVAPDLMQRSGGAAPQTY